MHGFTQPLGVELVEDKDDASPEKRRIVTVLGDRQLRHHRLCNGGTTSCSGNCHDGFYGFAEYVADDQCLILRWNFGADSGRIGRIPKLGLGVGGEQLVPFAIEDCSNLFQHVYTDQIGFAVHHRRKRSRCDRGQVGKRAPAPVFGFPEFINDIVYIGHEVSPRKVIIAQNERRVKAKELILLTK